MRIYRVRIGVTHRLGEEVAVVRQAEGREVFRESIDAGGPAVCRLEAAAVAIGAGVADIGDGVADGSVFFHKRIRADRVAPNTVRVVIVPVYVIGQVKDCIVQGKRLDVFRGYVDDVVRLAGSDLSLYLREVQVCIALERKADVDLVFADLVCMLFSILICPLLDQLPVCFLICGTGKDEDGKVIICISRYIRENKQCNHHNDQPKHDDLVDNFLHYVPPYKFHPRHGGGRKGRFAAFSWENAAEGPLPCSSDLPNGLGARRQTLRRKKKTPAQNKHFQPFPDERQNHCPFNASAHPPFARRLLYSYHNTQFSPCQYLNSNFL